MQIKSLFHKLDIKGLIKKIVIYSIAVLGMVWVFWDVDFSELKKDLIKTNWLLAFLGVFIDIGRYLNQSIRWKLLLKVISNISYLKTLQALYAGIFLNIVFPLRVGELARAYLASHFAKIKISAIMSSMIIEYLFDGIWFFLGIAVVAIFVPMPNEIKTATRILSIIMVLAVIIFVFLLFYKRNQSLYEEPKSHISLKRNPFLYIRHFLRSIRKNLQILGMSKYFWISFTISGLDEVYHIVAFWIIMVAYGIHLNFFIAAAILLFIFIGLIIPNTPSNIGSFQVLCVLGLLTFGVDKTTAAGFANVFFFLVLVPQVLFGAMAFTFSGKKLLDIRKKLSTINKRDLENDL